MFDSLKGRHRLRSALTNAGWLAADKIIRLGGGLVVGAAIARHLGPDQFGLWSYALAIASFFTALAGLGLDTIVVKELVDPKNDRRALLATAFVMKAAGGLLALMLATATTLFVAPGQHATLALVFLSSLGFVFQAALVADLDFQSQSLNRISATIQISTFVVISTVKIGLLFLDAPLIAFAATGALEAGLVCLLMICAFAQRNGLLDLRAFDLTMATSLIRSAWPLLLSSVAVAIYLRCDQVILGSQLDSHAVGQYSVAIRISEAWFFAPLALSVSVYPKLMELKLSDPLAFQHRSQDYFDVMSLLGMIAACSISLVGGLVIRLLFGDAYAPAATILALHAWSGYFVCLSIASSTWLTIEGQQVILLARTAIGCAISLGLNTLLIPPYGTSGAALSAIAAQAAVAYSALLFPSSRQCGLMLCKSAFRIPSVIRIAARKAQPGP